MKKLRLIAALAVMALTLGMFVPNVSAQGVPMLFTGTATFSGTPVGAGAKVVAFSAAGKAVGSATTDATSTWAMAVGPDVTLEKTLIYFYLTLLDGTLSPAAGVTATYDTTVGRANVVVAGVPAGPAPTGTAAPPTVAPTARPTAAATPGPVGDVSFSTSMLAGLVAAGALMLVVGGFMLRRKQGAQ